MHIGRTFAIRRRIQTPSHQKSLRLAHSSPTEATQLYQGCARTGNCDAQSTTDDPIPNVQDCLCGVGVTRTDSAKATIILLLTAVQPLTANSRVIWRIMGTPVIKGRPWCGGTQKLQREKNLLSAKRNGLLECRDS